MKIYVASKVEDKEEVKKLMKKLRGMGYEITRDWTQEEHVIRPYHINPDIGLKSETESFEKIDLELTKEEIEKESEKIAKEDLEAVINSDVFVVLVSKDVATGYNIELGVAIRNKILFGKPEIFLVGPYSNRSAMYFHPLIKRIDSVKDLFEYLKSVNK